MRVLVVEDDLTLQHGLKQILESAGHSTEVSGDGSEADALLATQSYDLVVLDLGLPGMDGICVLKRLRARRQTLPVLILSARDAIEQRVEGLDGGADDYLTKPFELAEFRARVRALLRRGQGAVVALGDLEWSWENRQAAVRQELLALSPHESTLLEIFVSAPERIVTKASLRQRIGDESDEAPDNMVEVYIHRLRRKLAGARLEIRTVRGLGYMLHELEPGVVAAVTAPDAGSDREPPAA